MMEVYQYGKDDLPPPMKQAFGDLYQHLTSGNDGRPWCRWCKPAVEKGTFYVCDARHLDSLDNTVRNLAETLRDLAASDDDGPSFPRSYQLLGWYSLTGWIDADENGEDKEERIQALRSELLRRGMVIGLVHPESKLKSLNESRGCPYMFEKSFINVRFVSQEDRIFVYPNRRLRKIFNRLDL